MLGTSFLGFFNTTCVSGQKKGFRQEKLAKKGYFLGPKISLVKVRNRLKMGYMT
jgi:hypothetical protein